MRKLTFTEAECRAAWLKLIKWQPSADSGEFGDCHCPNRALMISYQLPSDEGVTRANGTEEPCGYWCSQCDFSNGGSRAIERKASADEQAG